MRIAVVNNFFPPRAGGSAHLSEGLARRFAARGHEVLVVTGAYGGAPADEEQNGYRIVRLPSWSLPKTPLSFNFDINLTFGPRNSRRLFRLLDDFRPDVIHQHGQFLDLTFMTAVFARRRGVPTVLSVHTRLEHPSRLAHLLLSVADRTLVRLFVAIGRPHVVAMDKLMDRYIRRLYRVPPDRIIPIPVGVVTETRTDRTARDIRTEFGLGKGPIIVSLGHVIGVRDRVALVEAFARLRTNHPDAKLVVVGEVYEDDFLTLAGRLGITEHVVTTGAVDRASVSAFIDVADVAAHDLSGYGMGTANLEMMANGVPVVVAVDPDNFLSIGLESWENVVLVEPDEPDSIHRAIDRLLTDDAIRQRVAQGQRALVREHFDVEKVTGRHLELFEGLVEPGD